MAERTIPEPHPDELMTARIGAKNRALRAGLDISDPAVEKMINLTAEVHANSSAEIRWLRNLLNNRSN